MSEHGTAPGKPNANPGYALFQIAKALTTSATHPDGDARERALQRIAKWTEVLRGMLGGSIHVGSRTPLQDTPGWATLEVVTGGFATGKLLAGGPLQAHEEALLGKLPPVPDAKPRQVLNGYYLTDEGLAQLQEMLASGCYDVSLPEEGALLAVAWLALSGHADEARDLLDELGPYFPRLRFYPIPTGRPGPAGSRVFLQDVDRTIEQLKQVQPTPLILAQKEAIEVWIPLYDQVVALFLETVQGEPPPLGWPCQRYPDGWSERAKRLLDQYSALRQAHRLCGKPDRRKGNFAQLREYLRRCAEDPASLSGREVGRIRLLLGSYVAKYGTPGSTRHQEFRARQARATSNPTFDRIASALMKRLWAWPGNTGIDDLEAVTEPISADEAQAWHIPADTAVPPSLQKKVQRCLSGTVEDLAQRGIITSGEVLARVLPQITGELLAAGFADGAPRRLYAAIYRAFRRRRSLLLLNLESQIKIAELPWVAALDRQRNDSLSTRELAQQTLKELATLSLLSFPHAILPNKLLQEMRALAKEAQLDLPLVDEVAADIFMGEFSDKFRLAAQRAADLLEGTLYATYYGIDWNQVRQLPTASRERSQRGNDPFAEFCTARAGVTTDTRWSPAANGMIIEQQQILTTQNLAVLFAGLDLQTALQGRLEELARRCFTWVCRRQQMKVDNWHARLVMTKNTAYAWRQMLFYLSLLPEAGGQTFLAWAGDYLGRQKEEFQVRFQPVFHGLALAAAGRSPEDPPAGAKRFLGWSAAKR